MRSKSILSLIELVIMCLVFAAVSAVCLRAFVWSGQKAADSETETNAVFACQNMAETIKSCKGNFHEAAEILGAEKTDGGMVLTFDSKWKPAEGDCVYLVTAQRGNSENRLLGVCTVSAREKDGTEIFDLEVCWQEGCG